MAERFRRKVDAGQAQDYSQSVRSSGAKGFKFDEVEAQKRETERQRQEAVYGSSIDKSVSKSELDEQRLSQVIEKAEKDRQTSSTAATTSTATTSVKRSRSNRKLTDLERQIEAAKACASAVKASFSITSITHTDEESQAIARVAKNSALANFNKNEVGFEAEMYMCIYICGYVCVCMYGYIHCATK